MLDLEDKEIIELAKQEIEELESSIEIIEKDLKLLLLPKDNADDGAAYLEIRAGAGGDEAAIFASDLLRLYSRFCEREGWKFELMTNKVSEPAGTKEAVMKIDGDGVYELQLRDTWQTTHPIDFMVKVDSMAVQYAHIKFESNLYWALDDTIGYFEHQWLTDDMEYNTYTRCNRGRLDPGSDL